jgi:flagellar protein FlaG
MNIEHSTTAKHLSAAVQSGREHVRAPAPSAAVAEGRATHDDEARRAIADANRRLAQKASELTFEFDDSAARVVVKLVDKRTGEVLRQIPSEEALAIARALQDEAGVGALLRADA